MEQRNDTQLNTLQDNDTTEAKDQTDHRSGGSGDGGSGDGGNIGAKVAALMAKRSLTDRKPVVNPVPPQNV